MTLSHAGFLKVLKTVRTLTHLTLLAVLFCLKSLSLDPFGWLHDLTSNTSYQKSSLITGSPVSFCHMHIFITILIITGNDLISVLSKPL
jgi:hypothetical protein